MKIKNTYNTIVFFVAFIVMLAPSVAMAAFPNTRPADLIKKDQATLHGYYYDPFPNQIIYLSFSYSKTAPQNNSCSALNSLPDTKKTPYEKASTLKSTYSKIIQLLDPDTKYHFCFISYKESSTFGGFKTYTPVSYGEVLNFQTLKGFNINNNTSGTKTGGVSPRKTTPDDIGDVETYLASRTTDTEALFSGYVNHISGTAYAYFRYATLDKPPVFCNDIYGSAQRSSSATNPNAYGQISSNGGDVAFSTVVKGLTENTTYYYCAIVSNSAVNPTEIEYGPVQSFRTLPCQSCPKTHITSVGVSNVSSNTASLQGSYASIPQVDTYFEYKKESDTEWKKTSRDSHGANSYGRFNQTIASLSPSSLYQFRAVGEATTTTKIPGGGPTSKIFFGDTLSFRTGSGNLFDKYGWTEEPENPNPGDDDTTIDPEYPYTGGIDGNCSDGIQNGDETGIDTGGRCGKKTIDPENPFPNNGNCSDGIQNGDETGIDTGGRCFIPPLPTCFDGIQNNNETGIDTGGWCGNGNDGNCFDGIKNGDETGVDTGGRCVIPPLPTCFDGIKNHNETGIDTGGWCGNGGNNNGGKVIVITGGGGVSNSGGTTISSGGTTTISGGTITTNGGTTTISGGTTNINGQNTNINNGIATNTGGTATTTGGTTTLRGGTTTITYKDANGNTQTFITNSEVKITRNGDSNVVTFKDVNGNTQTIVIKDGEGQITNVGGVRTTENGNTTLRGGTTNVLDNRSGPRLGDRLTPPSDAIVRYHEGIETVFTRQIMRNLSFARLYGYDDSMNLQNFADTLSHTFAKEYFGYIDASGLEVRVSKPDVSAYELRQVGGVLTVYEYYENVIVDIRNTTTIFKNKNPYEYYDRRRR